MSDPLYQLGLFPGFDAQGHDSDPQSCPHASYVRTTQDHIFCNACGRTEFLVGSTRSLDEPSMKSTIRQLTDNYAERNRASVAGGRGGKREATLPPMSEECWSHLLDSAELIMQSQGIDGDAPPLDEEGGDYVPPPDEEF